jgi:CII-binding regulator of phage lambda lysogenization HflD
MFSRTIDIQRNLMYVLRFCQDWIQQHRRNFCTFQNQNEYNPLTHESELCTYERNIFLFRTELSSAFDEFEKIRNIVRTLQKEIQLKDKDITDILNSSREKYFHVLSPQGNYFDIISLMSG